MVLSQVTEFKIRSARRKAKELGLSKQQTDRLVKAWLRQGAK